MSPPKALSDEQRAYREQAHVEMLEVYCRTKEPDPHLFRTLFDHWYGYRLGGPFLNRGGRPHWFNSVKKDRRHILAPALRMMNFISVNAARALDGDSDEIVVKDHGIPLAIVRQKCMSAHERNPTELRRTMVENAWLGVITKTEHDRLCTLGARKSLPDCAISPMTKRYADADIHPDFGRKPFTAVANARFENLIDLLPAD